MDNDALNSMDELDSAVFAGLDGLAGLAPAAVQDGVGGGHPRRSRCVLRTHDAGENVDRASGMAPRQRADFGQRFSHLMTAFPMPPRPLAFLAATPCSRKSFPQRNGNETSQCERYQVCRHAGPLRVRELKMRHERLSSGHFRREPYLPEEAARGCGPWPRRVPTRSRAPANQLIWKIARWFGRQHACRRVLRSCAAIGRM